MLSLTLVIQAFVFIVSLCIVALSINFGIIVLERLGILWFQRGHKFRIVEFATYFLTTIGSLIVTAASFVVVARIIVVPFQSIAAIVLPLAAVTMVTITLLRLTMRLPNLWPLKPSFEELVIRLNRELADLRSKQADIVATSRLADEANKLEQIIALLRDSPDLRRPLERALRQEGRPDARRQMSIAIGQNLAFVIIGWLLSGLVDPSALLTRLFQH